VTEKSVFTHTLREARKKRDLQFFLVKDGRIGLTRLSDGDTFISNNIPALELCGYLLACLAERAGSEKLIDQNAVLNHAGKEVPALFVIRPTLRRRNDESLSFRAMPAVVSCQTVSQDTPSSVQATFSAMDILEVATGIPRQYPLPPVNLVAGQMLIKSNNGALTVRVGGSERAELSEENRRFVVHRLGRWLSGQYYAENAPVPEENDKADKSKNPYPGASFSRNGIYFNGRKEPRLRVHGISAVLSYKDVAVLYFVLKGLNGRPESETGRAARGVNG